MHSLFSECIELFAQSIWFTLILIAWRISFRIFPYFTQRVDIIHYPSISNSKPSYYRSLRNYNSVTNPMSPAKEKHHYIWTHLQLGFENVYYKFQLRCCCVEKEMKAGAGRKEDVERTIKYSPYYYNKGSGETEPRECY